jgi:hypothetical protein
VTYLFTIYFWDGAQPKISNSAVAATTVKSVKRIDRIMFFSVKFDSRHKNNIFHEIWSGQLFHRLFRFFVFALLLFIEVSQIGLFF